MLKLRAEQLRDVQETEKNAAKQGAAFELVDTINPEGFCRWLPHTVQCRSPPWARTKQIYLEPMDVALHPTVTTC